MKILKLTPEEFVDMACNNSDKYVLLEQNLIKTDESAYEYEYTYDYIFEVKETKEHYIVQMEVGDDFREDWEDYFLDSKCNKDFIICQKGFWINQPRFILEN